ncbi:hypothetical protein MTF65_02065 [Streptomyces sp. APSN-46.1]|nr:hypothetical protein [Streptomyces sp. APSN-46.1]
MLPFSSQDGSTTDVLTALFTSTSAVCVTGLVVVDTATHWSGFGEGVILALIQVGGFGIMAMASLLALLVSGKLRLRMQLTAAAETKSLGIGDIRRVLLGVAGCTLIVELAVGAFLALRLRFGYDRSFGEAAYSGFFHAVSAFNNAGFGLHGDSLTPYRACGTVRGGRESDTRPSSPARTGRPTSNGCSRAAGTTSVTFSR